MAIDFTPTVGVTVNRFWRHFLYNASPEDSACNLRLYEGANPRDGSLVSSWTIPWGNWVREDTGWVAFGRKVYLGKFPFADKTLTAPKTYWFAVQMDTVTQPTYWVWWTQIRGDMEWHFLSGTWRTSFETG